MSRVIYDEDTLYGNEKSPTTTPSPDCPSNRLPVALNEDCGEYSSTGFCNVTNSSCINEDGVWLCKCDRQHVEIDSECIKVPENIFDESYVFNVTSDVHKGIIGRIPLLHTNDIRGVINWTFSDHDVFEVQNQGQEIAVIKKDNSVLLSPMQMTVFSKVAVSDVNINSIFTVEINIYNETFEVYETVLIDGTPKNSIIASITNFKRTTYSNNLELQGNFEHFFRISNDGNVYTEQDIHLSNITDEQTYAMVTKLQVVHRWHAQQIVAEIDVAITRNVYTIHISESSQQNQLLGNFRFDSNTNVIISFPTNSKLFLNFNPSSGEIMTGSRIPDFENQNERETRFTIFIQLAKRSFQTHVNVFVTDENDNSPSFQGSHNDPEFLVISGSPAKSMVGFVHATDPDTVGTIEYKMTSDFFSLTPEGVITPLRTLTSNLFGSDSTDFPVTATDGVHNTTTTVTVTLITLSPNITDLGNIFVVNITENNNPNITVYRVEVQNYTNFKLISSDAKTSFNLNATSGELTTKSAFDREKQPSGFYNGEMSTEVLGVLKGEDNCNVTILGTLKIKILDQNDNQPCITYVEEKACVGGPLNGTILEGSPAGVPVNIGSITITDVDAGSRLTVNIQDSDSNPFKATLSPNGNLGIAVKDNISNDSFLDRETVPSYTFQLQIIDNHFDGIKTSTVTVHIVLEDKNDNPPTFQESSYNFSVPENEPHDSFVGKVNAVDKDEGNNAKISYKLYHSFFKIDDSGRITTTKEIDREVKSIYNLTVSATDKKFLTTAVVIINILDVNDNNPKFNQSEYIFSIYENTVGRLGNVMALDKDSGNNASITYQLMNRTFEILNNGTIYCNQALDYEKQPNVYNFHVLAFDGGEPRRNGSSRIHVHVNDINDNAPKFDEKSKNKNISISQRELQPDRIITFIEVSDADSGNNGKFTLALRGEIKDAFDITENGILKSGNAKTDVKTYHGTVIAVDHGIPSLTSSTSLTIQVTNRESNSDVQFNQTFYEFFVEENKTYSTSIGKVNVYPTNTGIQYSKEDTGQADNTFTLNRTTGEVFCRRVLDRELKDTYNLFVKATSTESGSSDLASVKINVTDVNDNRPRFTSNPAQIEVYENAKLGKEIVTFTSGNSWATDPDLGENGTVIYKIQSPPQPGHFGINRTSGKLFVNVSLDYETRRKYPLTIKAEDLGKPILWSTTTLEILLLDVNDNHPTFENKLDGDICYTVTIEEDAQPPREAFNFTITDDDGNVENKYSKIVVNGSCPLDVNDENDGDHTQFRKFLKLKERLDYETQKEHICVIYAINKEPPELSTVCKLKIDVRDVNDNAPQILHQPPVNVTNGVVGDKIANVNATDSDSGENGRFKFSITEGTYSDFFTVDSQTGVVSINKSFAFLPVNQVKLTICVIDYGQPSLSSSTLLIINILDTNKQPWFPGKDGSCNNRRTLERAVYTATITEKSGTLLENENEDISNYVLKVTACDTADNKSETCNCTYKFENGSSFFKIDKTTGIITQIKPVDRERNASFQLKITAKDHGSPPKKTECNAVINIAVLDLDDNGPTFPERKDMVFNIADTHKKGDCVANISVSDPDNGINATYNYYMDCPPVPVEECLFYMTNECVIVETSLKNYTDRTFARLITVIGKGEGGHRNSTNAYFQIVFEDPNKHQPNFSKAFYTTQLERSSQKGATIDTYLANDDDEGKEGEIIYTIINDNPYNMFKIDNTSGALTINDDVYNLVPPGISNITLWLRATDKGELPKHGECSVLLSLTPREYQCKLDKIVTSNPPGGHDTFKVPFIAVIAGAVVLISIMVFAFLFVLHRHKSSPKRKRLTFDTHKYSEEDHAYNDLQKEHDFVNPVHRPKDPYMSLCHREAESHGYRESQIPPADYM